MNTPTVPTPCLYRCFKRGGPWAMLMALCLIVPAQRAAAAPPPNDDRANATVIAGGSGRLAASNVDATKEAGEANHGGNVGGRSVWFRYVAPSAVSTRIDTVGSDFDTVLSVYRDSGGSLVLVAASDNLQAGQWYSANSGGYLESRGTFTATAGSTYFIAVDGYNLGTGAASGSVILNWNQASGTPPNDSFSSPIVLTGLTGGFSGRNQNGTKEPGEPNHAGDAGGRSIWYSWTPPVSGDAVVDVMGSSLDTLLGVYTGNAVASLTEIGSMDDHVNNLVLGSRVGFQAVAGTTYYIAVDGFGGGTGSAALHYYVSGDPPPNDAFASAIPLAGSRGTTNGSVLNATLETGEPLHAGNTLGSSVWYNWTAPADGLITFSTFGVVFDSVLAAYVGDDVTSLALVPGAVSDDVLGGALFLSRISFNAVAGTTYRIVVDAYDANHSVFNINWDQAVNPLTNDVFAGAMTLPGRSGTVTTSNTNAVYEQREPFTAVVGNLIRHPSVGGKSLWFKWTASSPRPVVFDTLGSSFDTTLAVLTGPDFASLTVLTNNDNLTNVSQVVTSLQSRIALSNVVIGTTYYIQADGYASAQPRPAESGTLVLNYLQVGGVPTNDNFANATIILGNSGMTNGGTIDATTEVNEPEHGGITPYASVWYKWTAPRDGWITFDTLLSPTLDTVLAVYTGDSLDMLTEVSANDDAVPGSVVQSSVSFRATTGTMYRLALDTKSPTQGDTTLRWRPTVALTGVRQPNNHLELTIVAATAGFYELQESSDLINWSTFDSVNFTDPSGGTTVYDAGDIASPAMRFFRVRQ